MKKVLQNILVKKNEDYCDIINITFWVIFFAKNNIKYIIAFFFLFENLKNISLLLIFLIIPILKYILIGINNINNFKKTALKRTNFLVVVALISKN